MWDRVASGRVPARLELELCAGRLARVWHARRCLERPLAGTAGAGHAHDVTLEFVPVRLHDEHGDDAGVVELPDGWTLELGDLLANERGRLVRVERLVPTPAGSPVGALIEVVPLTLYGRANA